MPDLALSWVASTPNCCESYRHPLVLTWKSETTRLAACCVRRMCFVWKTSLLLRSHNSKKPHTFATMPHASANCNFQKQPSCCCKVPCIPTRGCNLLHRLASNPLDMASCNHVCIACTARWQGTSPTSALLRWPTCLGRHRHRHKAHHTRHFQHNRAPRRP